MDSHSPRKTHILNPAPAFAQPDRHKHRPKFLEQAKIRARWLHVDQVPEWQEMRSRTGTEGRPGRRANTREERERVARALAESICHTVNLINMGVWGSQDLLAKHIKATNSQVSRCLDDFVGCGWVKVYHVYDLPNRKQFRTKIYVEDAFFLALGFSKAELDGARNLAIQLEVDKETARYGMVTSAILRREMQKMNVRVRRKRGAAVRRDNEAFYINKERTALIADLQKDYPKYSVRQLAELADEILIQQQKLRRRYSA